MSTIAYRPLHVWTRHHPTARRLAAQLPAAMLALPRWRVMADIRERFGVSDYMARQVVAIARKATADNAVDCVPRGASA